MGRLELANQDTSQCDSTMHNAGPTGRRHSWNRNRIKAKAWWNVPCLFIVGDWVQLFFFCYNSSELVAPAVGIHVLDGLELLAFACGCFQSDDILYMFERSWVGVWGGSFFPPPGCLLCSGVPFWLISPRLDRPAALCQPDADWWGQEWPFWHVSQSLVLWIASKKKIGLITQNVSLVP